MLENDNTKNEALSIARVTGSADVMKQLNTTI